MNIQPTMRPASGRSSHGDANGRRDMSMSGDRPRAAAAHRPIGLMTVGPSDDLGGSAEDQQAGRGHHGQVERHLGHPQQQDGEQHQRERARERAGAPVGASAAAARAATRPGAPGSKAAAATTPSAPTTSAHSRRSARKALQIVPTTASPCEVSNVERTIARPIDVAATAAPPARAMPSATRRRPSRRVGARRAAKASRMNPARRASGANEESRSASGAASTSAFSSRPPPSEKSTGSVVGTSRATVGRACGDRRPEVAPDAEERQRGRTHTDLRAGRVRGRRQAAVAEQRGVQRERAGPELLGKARAADDVADRGLDDRSARRRDPGCASSSRPVIRVAISSTTSSWCSAPVARAANACWSSTAWRA